MVRSQFGTGELSETLSMRATDEIFSMVADGFSVKQAFSIYTTARFATEEADELLSILDATLSGNPAATSKTIGDRYKYN